LHSVLNGVSTCEAVGDGSDLSRNSLAITRALDCNMFVHFVNAVRIDIIQVRSNYVD
jgi:hypothetical protein